MLEETLLIAEQAVHIALQLSRVGALHEAQLPIVNHLTAQEDIDILDIYKYVQEIKTINKKL